MRHRPQLKTPIAEKVFCLLKVQVLSHKKNLESESSLQLIISPKIHSLGSEQKEENWRGGEGRLTKL